MQELVPVQQQVHVRFEIRFSIFAYITRTIDGRPTGSGQEEVVESNSLMTAADLSLFILPTAILTVILAEWVDLRAVARLDSASCNRLMREEIMTLIKCHCIFHDVTLVNVNKTGIVKSVYNWFVCRSVRADSVYFGGNMFSVDSCRLCSEWLSITGDVLRIVRASQVHDLWDKIALHCRRLTSLSVEACALDSYFWRVVRENPDLAELRLHACQVNYQTIMNELSSLNLHKLIKIQLLGPCLDDTSLLALVRTARNLQTLQVFCTITERQYESSTVETLVTLCPSIINWSMHSHHITDASFCKIVSNLKSLQCLHTPNLAALTNASVDVITTHHAHSLKYLFLADHAEMNIDNLSRLINACTQLEWLYLSCACFKVDKLLSSIQRDNNITTLHVSATCTFRTMKAIAKNFPQVRTVGLSFSDEKDAENGLQLILHQCAHLHTLHETNMNLFARHLLEKHVPGLKVRNYSIELLDILSLPTEHSPVR